MSLLDGVVLSSRVLSSWSHSLAMSIANSIGTFVKKILPSKDTSISSPQRCILTKVEKSQEFLIWVGVLLTKGESRQHKCLDSW